MYHEKVVQSKKFFKDDSGQPSNNKKLERKECDMPRADIKAFGSMIKMHFTEPSDYHIVKVKEGTYRKKSPSPPPQILMLKRLSFNCPMCSKNIDDENAISHFIYDHDTPRSSPILEVNPKERTILVVSLEPMSPHATYCLDILALKRLKEATDCNISPSINMNLKRRHRQYHNHTPIFVMGCLTHWAQLYNSSDLGDRHLKNVSEQLYFQTLIVWLSTLRFQEKARATVTMFDKNLKKSRSKMLEMRYIHEPLKTADVIKGGSHFFCLNVAELRNQVSGDRVVNLEIILHYDDIE